MLITENNSSSFFLPRHYDKSKGGLQVIERDPAEVIRARIRKIIFFVVLAILVTIIVVAIIVVVVLNNLPEDKPATEIGK
jgi:hypothetical protein